MAKLTEDLASSPSSRRNAPSIATKPFSGRGQLISRAQAREERTRSWPKRCRARKGTAGRLLARGQLPVGRPDLSLRQPAAEGAADQGAHQAAAARPLGHDARPELHLRPPQPRDQEARPQHDLHHRPRPRRARRWWPTPISKGRTARSTRTSRQDEDGHEAALQAVLLPGRHPQPRGAGDAGLDPRGRRARLRPLARLRGGLRQSRSDRRLRRRRRRGGDRAAGDELALEQVPQPGDRRRGAADPAPQRLQDRQSHASSPGSATRSWTSCSAATATRRTSSRATTRRRCTS